MCKTKIIFGIFLICTSSVSAYQVVPVSSSPLVGATASTFYDCLTKSVYYGDYFGNGTLPVLYRYDWVANIHYSAKIQGYSGGVSLIPMSGISSSLYLVVVLLLYTGMGSQRQQANSVKYFALYSGTAQVSYCDTEVSPESSLYRYDRLLGVTRNFNGLRASSAMNWNMLTGRFYHKDVCQYDIMEYQWWPLTGELTNGRSIFRFTDRNSVANGMVIDRSGMLYVTLYNASSVVKIDPRTSTVVETYVLPARFPTSITFCGPLLDTLCVNTGNVAVNTNTGSISTTSITSSDGKLYMIKGLAAFTAGVCDHKVCL